MADNDNPLKRIVITIGTSGFSTEEVGNLLLYLREATDRAMDEAVNNTITRDGLSYGYANVIVEDGHPDDYNPGGK